MTEELFPDTTPEERAAAEVLVKKYTDTLESIDVYDVLLARNLSHFADGFMKEDANLRTRATDRMFGGKDSRSELSLILLAQFVRRMHGGTYEGETLNMWGVALVNAVLGPLAAATQNGAHKLGKLKKG